MIQDVIQQMKSLARNRLPASIYGRIRARRVHGFVKGFEPRTVEHDYGGFPLRIHLEDPLAQGWYDCDWDEPAEIAELRNGRLHPGARVLDIGAHQGVLALILARIVGPEGHVVAVEAEPHNAAVAQRNAEENGARNVSVLHAAAGATNGTLSFTEGLNGRVAPQGSPGAIEVPSLTVDELVRRSGLPDVVLVDVEGYEAHVLAGASATIATAATDFFIELHAVGTLAAAGSTPDDVLRCFADKPFDVSVALVDDTPPGLNTSGLLTGWEDVSSMLHQKGRRCFVLARPKPG